MVGRETPHESHWRKDGEIWTFYKPGLDMVLTDSVLFQAYLLIEEDILDLAQSDEYRSVLFIHFFFLTGRWGVYIRSINADTFNKVHPFCPLFQG